MKVGTKSILFGGHQFMIHPWFVAWAWWKLYGFPFDPRLWVAFFVHDLGYWGKPNMDGLEGETHPELGAKIMSIFGDKWRRFTLYHSRFYARKDNSSFSKLCVADKLSLCLMPKKLYLFLVNLSGEINEYISQAKDDGKFSHMNLSTKSQSEWVDSACKYLSNWVDHHAFLEEDEWIERG